MLIDNKYTNKISGLNLSEVFRSALSNAYKEFSFQVMVDMTTFKYEPKNYSVFVGLGLASREYSLQKYFEPRLDTYIRDLIYGIVETVLEDRDFSVYRPSLPDEYCDPDKYYSTKEYERKAGFEFVIHDGKELIGYRFTDIQDYEAAKFLDSGLLTKIIVIDWENPHGISNEEKQKKYWGSHGKQIDVVGYEDAFIRIFGENEGQAFNLLLMHVTELFRNAIGISSIPKLTPPMLFQHRLEEEQILKEKCAEAPLGYQIIENENSEEYSDIERRSQELINLSGLRELYIRKKFYKALVGKSDYARSFLTSEYLYQQFNNNDMFDYTAVVSGYLKSVEQLMYQIVLQYVGKRDTEGRLYRVGPANRKVTLTSDHVAENKISATMGNLIFFFKTDYPETVSISDEECRKTFIDCLEVYLDECRNQSFHKHNNYDWNRVERIRNNTFVMYTLLLGACVCLDDTAYPEHFSIVEDDRLERIYYWLRKKEMYTFKVKMAGTSDYLVATREAEREFPEFDEYGLLVDFSIPIGCSKEMNTPKSEYINLEISRNQIPDEVWHTTYISEDPIDFSL